MVWHDWAAILFWRLRVSEAVIDLSRREGNTLAGGAIFGLAALTLVNLLNYLDRYLISVLLPDIQAELHLGDAAAGALGSVFIIVYLVTSPLFGWLGDRGLRKRYLALGVGLWSLATGLAGLARSYTTLLGSRAAVGIGEAAYGTISPTLIADYVPTARRGRAMAIFSAAIPVGSALGYVVGGQLGAALGWRQAFFAVGFPGLLLALALLFLREPERGRLDPASERGVVPFRAAYRELWRNRTYVWTVAGYIAYTFAIGGLGVWAPSYMMRVRGMPQADGMLVFGGIVVVTGTLGTLLGGAIGDRLQAWRPDGYALLNGWATLAGALLCFVALLLPSNAAFLSLLALAELFLFASTGPVNAIIVNSIRPGMRATASAACIFAIHLLGDAISPTLIGVVADASSLARAIVLVPAVFALAGVLWLASARFVCETPRALLYS